MGGVAPRVAEALEEMMGGVAGSSEEVSLGVSEELAEVVGEVQKRIQLPKHFPWLSKLTE